MLAHLFRRSDASPSELFTSKLFDQDTFYPAFRKDLERCSDEVIIECPFVTTKRVDMLLPTFQKLIKRGVRIVINTRDPWEHDEYLRLEAQEAIPILQAMGVHVLFTGSHHRKLAIVDRRVLWEGSLNILSQNDSCEIMRRIQSIRLATQMINFLKLRKFLIR